MRSQAESPRGRADRRQRQHLMERSFAPGLATGSSGRARASCGGYPFKKYLTATIQNIMILLRHCNKPLKAVAKRVKPAAGCNSLKPTACPRICIGLRAGANHRRPVRLASARSESELWATTRQDVTP